MLRTEQPPQREHSPCTPLFAFEPVTNPGTEKLQVGDVFLPGNAACRLQIFPGQAERTEDSLESFFFAAASARRGLFRCRLSRPDQSLQTMRFHPLGKRFIGQVILGPSSRTREFFAFVFLCWHRFIVLSDAARAAFRLLPYLGH